MHFIRAVASHTKVFKIPAKIKSLHDIDYQKVFRAPDNKTAKLPAILYIYPGMPCRISANLCIPKGVANGAKGTVFHIDWPEGVSFQIDSSDGCYIPSLEPLNVYVNIDDAPDGPRFPGLPDHWPSTVVPIPQERKDAYHDEKRIAVKQFPIIPAFAGTCHGVQGLTCKSICVANPRPMSYKNPERTGLYVALSRVTTSKGLVLLEDLTSEDFNYFRPGVSVLEEDDRLQKLSDLTISSATECIFRDP